MYAFRHTCRKQGDETAYGDTIYGSKIYDKHPIYNKPLLCKDFSCKPNVKKCCYIMILGLTRLWFHHYSSLPHKFLSLYNVHLNFLGDNYGIFINFRQLHLIGFPHKWYVINKTHLDNKIYLEDTKIISWEGDCWKYVSGIKDLQKISKLCLDFVDPWNVELCSYFVYLDQIVFVKQNVAPLILGVLKHSS